MNRSDAILIQLNSTGRTLKVSPSELSDLRKSAFKVLEAPDQGRYYHPIRIIPETGNPYIVSTQGAAARHLGVCRQAITQALLTGYKVRNCRIEEVPLE